MTFGEIKSTVASYLERESAELSAGALSLLGVGVNNARRFAERAHDFAHLHSYGKLLLPAGEDGVNLSAMTTVAGGALNVKTVLQFYRRTTGGDYPLRTMDKATFVRLTENRHAEYTANTLDLVAPADFDVVPQAVDYNRILRIGNKIFYYPTPSTQLELRADVVIWAEDYVSDTDTDFFTERASDYLIMRSVVEVNHLTGSYAYRAEGNLPPPEKLASELLNSIIEQDKHSLDSGLTPEMF